MCPGDPDQPTVPLPDELTPVQESLLLTLYLRALDARSADPILGDTASAERAEALEYDFSRQRVQPSLVLDLATRPVPTPDLARRRRRPHDRRVLV